MPRSICPPVYLFIYLNVCVWCVPEGGLRHVGEVDEAVPDRAEGGEDLGEGGDNEVLAMPAQQRCQPTARIITVTQA